MKCPPHVANSLTESVPNQYTVRLFKGNLTTQVAHLEKKCRDCKLPVIILSETLLSIIEQDGWEIQVEIPDSC